MATFLISVFSFQKSNDEKHKNGHNLVILAKKKTTLFSSTLKIGEKKVFFSSLKHRDIDIYFLQGKNT